MAVGIAGIELPARQQFSRNLQLDPARGHARHRHVGHAAVGKLRATGIQLGHVFLLKLEEGDAGVQPAVQIFALGAHFHAFSGQRIQLPIVRVEVEGLRFEDIGVADVDRVVRVYVERHAGVGDELVVHRRAVAGARSAAERGFLLPGVVGKPSAQDHREAVRGPERRRAVEDLLRHFDVEIQQVLVDGGLEAVVVPIEGIRDPQVGQPVVARRCRMRACGVVAEDQVVPPAQ
ncbi:hypothetical protein D3C71_1414800 [compost metagenome]